MSGTVVLFIHATVVQKYTYPAFHYLDLGHISIQGTPNLLRCLGSPNWVEFSLIQGGNYGSVISEISLRLENIRHRQELMEINMEHCFINYS